MVGQVGEVTDRREYDIDWFEGLSDDGQARVTKWLSHVAHPVIVSVILTDKSGLVGDLTIVEIDDDDEQYLRLVEQVHWDDPFPEDVS